MPDIVQPLARLGFESAQKDEVGLSIRESPLSYSSGPVLFLRKIRTHHIHPSFAVLLSFNRDSTSLHRTKPNLLNQTSKPSHHTTSTSTTLGVLGGPRPVLPPRAGEERGGLQLWPEFTQAVPRLLKAAGRATGLQPDQLQPPLPRRRGWRWRV